MTDYNTAIDRMVSYIAKKLNISVVRKYYVVYIDHGTDNVFQVGGKSDEELYEKLYKIYRKVKEMFPYERRD